MQGAGIPENDVIITFIVSFAELGQVGRSFKWKIPDCPCGSKKVWGHGFVSRILEGNLVELKRYRCANCRKVFTLRPKIFWPWFQTSVELIFKALWNRLTKRRWPKNTTRQRGGYWLRLFQRFAEKHFPGQNQITLLQTLHERDVCFLH